MNDLRMTRCVAIAAAVSAVMSAACSGGGSSSASATAVGAAVTRAVPDTADVAPAPADVAPAAPAAAPPTTAAPTAEEREAMRRKAQVDWALAQDAINHDPNGQWATQATASSTYNDATGTSPYAASQAAGAPNVQVYSTTPQAWGPKTADAGIEWIQLTFAKPVHATAVRIRESAGSGAIIKVEVVDDKGIAHVVWNGTDTTTDLNYLVVEFPKTVFTTNRVKVTLATNLVQGWNQIDAVQLVGSDQ